MIAMRAYRARDQHWEVDNATEPGILRLRLQGRFTAAEMQAFVTAHNAAIDAFEGADYKVFCDIRGLTPLSPECAQLLETAKAYSDSRPNFRGSAVWVDNPIVSMQHARTSKQSGVLPTELLSADEGALRQHLASVWRQTR
jgi:hypothetical protein